MSILLVIAMIVSLFTAVPFAFDAASAVAYLDRRWDSDTGKTVDSVLTQSWCIDIRDRSSNHLQSGAWYAVTTDTTISERLYIDSGTVHIILCDGATLTDRKGIGVSASATLAIYGQQNDTGKMYMHFDTNSYEMKGDYAVIGADSGDTGTINIYGGTLDLDSCYYSKGVVIGGGKDGNKVETDGYSFIMPESAVTVKATFAHLVQARDAYTDSNGEYFPGVIAHYTDGERYYAVNEDGSIGEDLSNVEVSDYAFELQEDGTYQIDYFKGSAIVDVFTVPKLYHGKKITALGNDDYECLFAGSHTQFELVLNENIREIKPYAFYSMYVTKVSGDTSALSVIGASAFSGVNYPGGNTLNLTLLYPGTVTVEKDTFRDLSMTVHLSHGTRFNRSDLILKDIAYDFTDAHLYAEPVWSWEDDHSAATATFTCSDARCEESRTLTAAVSVTETREKTTYTASVSFGGETYTDTIEILNNVHTVTVAPAEHGTVTADAASAYAGDTIALDAVPDVGYRFESFSVTSANGEETAVSDNSFTMPAGDVTVTATFAPIDYTVTYEENENGTVTGAESAHCGDVVTLMVKPDKDSYFVSLSVTGASGEPVVVTDKQFTMPAQNVTVKAVFSLIEGNQCGPDLYWKLDKSTETLTIYGTGAMFDYNNDQMIRAPWYRSFSYIDNIVIEDGATSIGNWAFAYCTATNVAIPETVTSIGNNAFQDTRMTAVRLPDSVTTIGRAAFRDCSYLDGLTIPAGVTFIGEDAFKDVGNLFDVYCYADPAALTWDGGYYDDFLPSKRTKIHVSGD